MKSTFKLRKIRRSICSVLCTGLLFGLAAPAMVASANDAAFAVLSITPRPFVQKDGRQETTLTYHNGAAAFPAWARVEVAGQAAYTVSLGTLSAGRGTAMLPITDTNALLRPGETTDLTVNLYKNAECTGSPAATYTDMAWARTRHWQFYLSQEMHTDLGYTGYQEDLKKAFSDYLDTVQLYMQKSDHRESDLEKYKYAIESGFMLGDAYMQTRSADQIGNLLSWIQNGRIAVGAGAFNFTMENFSAEETARAAYYTNRYLVDKLGIAPATTQRMFDNPSFSKAYVDIAASAGIKYGVHSMNPDRSPYYKEKQYDLFYMEGMNPQNRLLIFNGKHYGDNYGFGGDHGSAEGSPDLASSRLLSLISELESKTGRNAYPYDKFPLALVPTGDNRPPLENQIIIANAVNKDWDEAGYAWPRITTAFPEQFFEEVEAEYGSMIPIETGTEENWWNDGWATTAYESGINKIAGNRIPVAETLSSFATLLTGKEYPYEALKEAVDRNLIYDEHTWGSASYDGGEQYNRQFAWKRSNAFGAISLADMLLEDAMQSMAKTVPTDGKAIYVYNPLNWVRDDVVKLSDISGFPSCFEIRDGAVSIPYTVEDGVLTFIAPDVPALGYKTFTIEAVSVAPSFENGTSAVDNVIQNEYYTVTFAADGTIASILDRKNGNRELVDTSAEESFNQYRYYDDHGVPFSNEGADFGADKWTLYTPEESAATLTVENTAVGVTARLNTSTFRAGTIVQTVTLYNGLPRIDIQNEVIKTALPSLQSKEEAFYTFPFSASDHYEIRYDLPVGNVAEGEQVYGTSTDWYTVSKWIGVRDQADGYNMVLATPDTGLAQFGERRTGSWSFDYRSKNPYIYSYVMNNMWQTNFQGDQPGYVSFRYAISTNVDAGMGQNARFGYEVSLPLQATVIQAAQSPEMPRALSDSFVSVSTDRVQLTTMKTAEANADGMILRFYEITGQDAQNVTVTLPFEATSIFETDIVENDQAQIGEGSHFRFSIPAYGMKTFRIRFGDAPAKVTGLTAVTPDIASTVSLSAAATATASSCYADDYAPDNALYIADGKDWASKGEKNAWYQLTWETPVRVSVIRIADRPNSTDNLNSIKLTFSDGSSQTVTDIPADGSVREIVLDEPVLTTYVRAELFGTAGCMNVGLSGLELYGPEAVSFRTTGTQLTWNAVDGAVLYEVFRSTDRDFIPGSGNYLTSVGDTTCFDSQVTGEAEHTYYYKVRAVAAGTKGEASVAASPVVGSLRDETAPDTPILHAQTRSGGRIDLYWTPVSDNVSLSHYEVWRDGVRIAETGDSYLVAYRDEGLASGTTYSYVVKAVDSNGNVAASEAVKAATFDFSACLTGIRVSLGTISPRFAADVYYYNLNLGSLLGQTEGISVTAETSSETAKITINGQPVESGLPSDPIAIRAAGDRIVIEVTDQNVTRSYTLMAGAGDPLILPSSASTGNAYEPAQGGQTPTHLIDGSGMSGQSALSDTHDNHTSAFTMWHTGANPGESAWVQIDLGSLYPLDKMYVWNLNQQDHAGRGLKNVRIEYSTNGAKWTTLKLPEGMQFADSNAEYPFQLAKAVGTGSTAATNLNDGKHTPVFFDGAVARYVRITAQPEVGQGSWGEEYFGLSELRFTRMMVSDTVRPVRSIRLTAANDRMKITKAGGSLQLTAEIQPQNATYPEVIYTVMEENGDPTEKAVISADGVLTARANGRVKVVATAVDNAAIMAEAFVDICGQPVVLTGVRAKAGNAYDEGRGANNVVNSSGMSGGRSVYDTHDQAQNGDTMWHTGANPGETAWIEFDLGSVQWVEEMWVWNMSQLNSVDRGLKQVKIEYRSEEAEDWIELRGEGAAQTGDYPYLFAKASETAALPATNMKNGQPIRLGLWTRYIRITANPEVGQGSWGSAYYGLSEVRFTGTSHAPDAAVQEVTDQIADLPTDISAAHAETVRAARSAYDALTSAQQRNITNYDRLLWAEAQLAALPSGRRGDIDGDGKVTVSDVVELRKQIVDGTAREAVCDLDGDGSVTVSDVVELRKQIVDGDGTTK